MVDIRLLRIAIEILPQPAGDNASASHKVSMLKFRGGFVRLHSKQSYPPA